MTIEVRNEYGKISVAEDLVSVVAGYAAVENYGIVGMCSKRTGDTLAELLGRDSLKKGIKVTTVGDNLVDIDLYVILQYGVSLPAVASNCKSNVKYRVEEFTGVNVNSVNIHVEGIRVV
jgi:uncharacterized alkaline shock family protein YloU